MHTTAETRQDFIARFLVVSDTAMALKFALLVALALILAVFYGQDTFDPESIRGKRVLITGSSSGIGEELAYQYSKLGASVIVTARREELLKKVAAKCKELGAKKVEYVVADMERPEDRQRLVTAMEKHLGGLDHLILNHELINTGIWVGSAENLTSLQSQITVNLIAYVDVASKCLRMLTDSRGNIGVVSSMCGKVGAAYWASHAAYKFAIHGFFSSLRQELRLKEAGVSVTFCVMDFVGTDSTIKLSAKEFPYAAAAVQNFPVHDAAAAIMRGVAKRAYEIYHPTMAWVTINIYRFLPRYIEDDFSLGMHQAKYGP